jgi:hypothetical protein
VTTDPDLLAVDEVVTLADDLLRLLADHIGDPDAIDDALRHWTETLGAARLGQVCAVAVRTAFAECMTRVPELPANGTTFTTPLTDPTPH